MKFILKGILGCFVLLFVILMGMIVFGDVQSPPVMHSINEVAAKVNRSDIPPISRFPARDGVHLAYRAYPATAEKIAILLHGSSASGRAIHAMGKALSANGIKTFALDTRGHGDSGVRGNIGVPASCVQRLKTIMDV